MRALIDLATSVLEGEKAQDVSDLVKSAMRQIRAENEAKAASDIVSLVRKIEEHKVTKRTEIRQLKAKLNQIVAALNDLDRRWEYAQGSNNFLPVLRFFDMVVPSDLVDPSSFDDVTTVPTSFKAKKKK